MLIEKGAMLDIKGEKGNTALHIVSYKGCLDVCKMIIQKGGSVDIKNNNKLTALDIAE